MSESYADLLAATALSATNADFIETLYQQYLSDPKSVDPGWARYFAGLKSKVAVQTGATRTFAAPNSNYSLLNAFSRDMRTTSV